MGIRTDEQTGLGSVLDCIRAKNGIASNHAAALLALILSKHGNLNIQKGRLNHKGRETPLATYETLHRILDLCPAVRADTRKHSSDAVKKMLKKPQLSIIEIRKKCSKHIYKTTNSFGPLSCMVQSYKIKR